jgi:Icc-related predicted phosphoesterase
LAFSDIHGHLPDLDVSYADCVMIAGDICPDGPGLNIAEIQKTWLEEKFCPWVENLKVPVYLTLGNHDFVDNFEAPMNLRYGTERILDDILLFSWTPFYFNFAWMASEAELTVKLKTLLTSGQAPSIWLTHGPPWGVCDSWKDASGRNHSGSHALRAAIEKYQPRLLICGHIHEGAGVGKLGRTEIYNVSILDSSNDWHGQPALIEI